MFILDALVVIEMVKNRAFPATFDDDRPGEVGRVERRKALYMMQLKHAFEDESLLKGTCLDRVGSSTDRGQKIQANTLHLGQRPANTQTTVLRWGLTNHNAL